MSKQKENEFTQIAQEMSNAIYSVISKHSAIITYWDTDSINFIINKKQYKFSLKLEEIRRNGNS